MWMGAKEGQKASFLGKLAASGTHEESRGRGGGGRGLGALLSLEHNVLSETPADENWHVNILKTFLFIQTVIYRFSLHSTVMAVIKAMNVVHCNVRFCIILGQN